jgi:hypothetical protein
MKTRLVIKAHVPEEDRRKILYFEVSREYKGPRGGPIKSQPIARVIIGKRMNRTRAKAIAQSIFANPKDIPAIDGVVDMRQSSPVPIYTLEAPGPDGWSPVPKGLEVKP